MQVQLDIRDTKKAGYEGYSRCIFKKNDSETYTGNDASTDHDTVTEFNDYQAKLLI